MSGTSIAYSDTRFGGDLRFDRQPAAHSFDFSGPLLGPMDGIGIALAIVMTLGPLAAYAAGLGA